MEANELKNMNATELRIGNYINEKEYGSTVESICKGTVYTNGLSYRYSQLKPIPLTEEWLLKFGFEKDEDDDFYLDAGYFDFCYQNKKWYLRQDGELFDLIDFDYVHQLQNLYFVLTNEELTIKE